MTELAGRTARLREAQHDEHAIALIVETFRTASGVWGKLTVRKPDGDLTVREVPGVDCREVESAMALIAALMVDPLAGGFERSAPNAAPRPSAPAPKSDSSKLASSAWSWQVEQRLTARTAIAPGLTWGQALGVTLTHEAGGAHPSAGLSAHVAHATASASRGAAELEWAAAQLALCPVGLRPGADWDLRACAAFQLGRLRGIGFRTANRATEAFVWPAAAVELEGRYRLLGPLWLGWETAFTVPFSRERFYLDPQQVLHRVPGWGVSFGLGLGLRFF